MMKISFIISLFAALFLRGAFAAEVAVVAHDAGFNTSLAKHLQRWLRDEKIAADLLTPAEAATALKNSRIAFLIGYNDPTASELNVLRDFRARGGKLVVFHSASPQLAAMMGVKPVGYTNAAYPGRWSRMDFSVNFPAGVPASIRQTSTVLQRAVPISGRSRVMATWSDRSGKPTGDAAWLSSAAGFWMTHVLLADGDESLKAQFVAALVGSICPHLWNYDAFKNRKAAETAELTAYARAQKPVAGEIHAVWEHSGCGLYPGDWRRTMRLLKDARVTDIFVNVAGAGFAHYPSDILPRSKIFQQEGDQLKACVDAAREYGIRVHAWVMCFTATRGSPEAIKALRQKGWTLKTREGADTEYLNPANPAVRNYVIAAIDEIQRKYKVDGIHLDFVRWYERSAKPANASVVISQFVTDVRRHVRRPAWLTAAVLGRYPKCIESVGQDWSAWLNSNIVDYVAPMDYTESMLKFESFLIQHAALRGHAKRTIVGIGVTANESRLGAREVIDQIRAARRYGVAGVSLFDLDATLEKQILPYLTLGIW